MRFTTTTSLPRPNAERDDQCGAFYNLYRVIGDNSYGVPATDLASPYEQMEMLIARVRCNVCTRSNREYISIQEMIQEANGVVCEIDGKRWCFKRR